MKSCKVESPLLPGTYSLRSERVLGSCGCFFVYLHFFCFCICYQGLYVCASAFFSVIAIDLCCFCLFVYLVWHHFGFTALAVCRIFARYFSATEAIESKSKNAFDVFLLSRQQAQAQWDSIMDTAIQRTALVDG